MWATLLAAMARGLSAGMLRMGWKIERQSKSRMVKRSRRSK
jgi:hypothetical protein